MNCPDQDAMFVVTFLLFRALKLCMDDGDSTGPRPS